MNLDDLDPEIAALLAEASSDMSSFSLDDSNMPNPFDDDDTRVSAGGVDLSIKAFAPVTKLYNDVPHKVFDDPDYYKQALTNENDAAKRLHTTLSKFLTAQDPKDRSVFRQQITTIYWEFLKSVVPKMTSPSVSPIKKYLLRYGVVLPSLFSPEQKKLFASVIDENTSGEPIYYLDEWFREIASGRINLSATDEVRPQRKAGQGSGSADAQRLLQLQQKNAGKIQTAENFVRAKMNERGLIEAELRSRIEQLCEHPPLAGLPEFTSPLTEPQRRMTAEITEKLKILLKIDKELMMYIADFQTAKEDGESIQKKMDSAEITTDISNSDIMTELDTVRQMAKMTVGRQGNHFPIMTREYYHCAPRETGFRENVINVMTWIESIDPGAYCRIHKNMSNRIVPYVIVVPTYGDSGFCWEPFDRYNRVTSRGRIAIPMYPKSLQIALLTAVADLRWQVAKEKASYYWMEEGLTGQYYQWFDAQKLKGDVKEYFINDYILWMTKESDGIQRLDRELRGIFWRNMPYPQELKDKLKTRSIVYQELCQKDLNRAMSDGY